MVHPPVNEATLRAYFKCSQLHWYGNTLELDQMTQLVRQTIERILLMKLSGSEIDNDKILSEVLVSVMGELRRVTKKPAAELMEIQAAIVNLVVEFFKIFSFKLYQPIYGPSTVRVRVSKTPIDAQFSGLLRRHDSQELHMIVWTPYITHQDQLNDPLNALRIRAFTQFVKNSTNRPNCTIHLLSVTKDQLLYSSINDKDISEWYEAQLHAKIMDFEKKVHFPLVPCPYNCPHRSYCNPLRPKEKNESSSRSDQQVSDRRFKRLF